MPGFERKYSQVLDHWKDIGIGGRMGWAEMWRNSRRSLLTIFSISLGIASVLAMNSILRGTHTQALESLKRMGGVEMISVESISPSTLQEEIEFAQSPGLTYMQLQDIAKRMDNVEALFPEAEERGNNIRGSRSVDRAHLSAVTWDHFRQFNVEIGNRTLPLDFLARSWEDGEPLCVLSDHLAERLFPGERDVLGRTVIHGDLRLKVGGIRPSGKRFDWGRRRIYYPWALHVRRVSGSAGKLDEIKVKVRDFTRIDKTVEELERMLLREHRGVKDFAISTPEEEIAESRQSARVMNIVGYGIASIAIVVGGIGILNLMLATVNGRIREIGVRKALGATHAGILSQFLAEAVALSCAGTVVGLLLGSAPTWLPGEALPMQPQLIFADYLLASAIGFLTGLLAGIYPALKAARHSPVEALQYA